MLKAQLLTYVMKEENSFKHGNEIKVRTKKETTVPWCVVYFRV